MKISTSLSISVLSLLTVACSNSDKNTNSNGSDTLLMSEQEVTIDPVVAQRDSLIALFNDISGDIIQIKDMEAIISLPANMQTENGRTVPQMRDDLLAIQQTLQIRRQKLEELEKKLKATDQQNADYASRNGELLKMIDNLKTQMAENEKTITSLTEQLAAAKTTITELNTTVDSLNTSVANVTAEKNAAEEKNLQLTNEMNPCFYALGSKSELKSHKIIETGFLKKTKIMQGDFETGYFTKADRRSLTTIPLYSKNAKVLTNQPKDSYSISKDANGNKTLNIMNPTKFWSTGNYLVIQTD